jgi:hypothetical protein
MMMCFCEALGLIAEWDFLMLALLRAGRTIDPPKISE